MCVCVCQGRVVELGGVYVLSGVMSCRVNSLFECLCMCVCVCQERVVELGGVYVLSGVMSCRVNSLFECLCVCVCVKDVSWS